MSQGGDTHTHTQNKIKTKNKTRTTENQKSLFGLDPKQTSWARITFLIPKKNLIHKTKFLSKKFFLEIKIVI